MRRRGLIKHIILSILFFSTTLQAVKAGNNADKSDSTEVNLVKLRKLYSVNKTIPSEFEEEILTSLSYYPELRKVKIKFCYASIFTSMKAVPSIGFLFQKRENRTDLIVMNKKECSGKNMMQRVTSKALTGVLGHELGHIKDYSRLSNSGLLKLMISYITKKGRIETEKRADKIAVEHNLGKELLEFNNHILNDACMNPKYIRYKKKFYNSSSSLSNMVESHKDVTAF